MLSSSALAMRNLRMPSSNDMKGPPSYTGSGMTTNKQQSEAGSVSMLERLRKLGDEGRKRVGEMDEEKKDASPRGPSVSPIRKRPYSPSETIVLNANTLSPNKQPLDTRLLMGLPPKEVMESRSRPPSQERASSPDIRPTASNVAKYKALQSHASPTTQQVPLTHSQLLESLKKKHEFDDILADIIPTDVKTLRTRGRLRTREDKKRKKRERKLRSQSPPYNLRSTSPGNRRSASPSSRGSSPYNSSIERASTAKHDSRPQPIVEHKPLAPTTSLSSEMGALSVYEMGDSNYEVVEAFDGYSSGEFSDSMEFSSGEYAASIASKVLKKPWKSYDRAKRSKKRRDNEGRSSREFKRPKDDSKWDYDDMGYLWADDEALETEKDKMAMERKRRLLRGKNNLQAEKARDLMEAYGSDLDIRKGRERVDLKGYGEGMGMAEGDLKLPKIRQGDARRNFMRDYFSGPKEKGEDAWDRGFEELDRAEMVVRNHLGDLVKEKGYEEGREKGIRMGIVWEIEKIKQTLPLSFLKSWGIGGDLEVRKSVKIIVRVVNRIRYGVIMAFWTRWRREVNRQIEEEFNRKMLLFQQGGALKTFEAIGRRCLKYASFAGFLQWKKQIDKWKFEEEMGEMVGAARVIQNYIRIRQDGLRSMKSMRAVVEVALHNRKMIHMVLDFERLKTGLEVYHQTLNGTKEREDEAAQIIRRNWNAYKSRGGVMSLIMNTRARKKKAQEELEDRMSRVMQRAWRGKKDRVGLLLFRVARRKRIVAERRARELKEEEEALGQWQKQHRSEMASVIQKSYRCHLFNMRFDKKAAEKKRLRLERQLIEHKAAKKIQKNFRTYLFLVKFNHKAHERKKKWMKEAEEKALREYKAACFLQDCYRRSHNRYLMSQRFSMRKDMLLQAQVLLAQNKAALVIQMQWNRFKGRENLQMKIMKRKLREEEEKSNRLKLAQKKAIFKQRTKAVKIIQKNFRTYRFLVTFNSRAYERKQAWLARQLLEHEMATLIQKNFRTYRFLVTFNSKAYERKQKWLAKQLLEHNSACIIQKNFRTYRFLMAFNQKAHERKKRWMREAEQAAQEKYRLFLADNATQIQKFCVAAFERYNQPVRILARRQLEIKRKKLQEELAHEMEVAAAKVVQRCWRKKGERDMLMGRFTKRRALMEKRGHEQMKQGKATLIAFAYLRHLDRRALKDRVKQRQMLHEKIADHRMRDAKARVLQRNYRLSRARYVQSLKFEQMRKRLATERLLEEQTALAELAARRAAEARMAAEEALKQMVNQGWKLGSDERGTNYWYNWVTGESTWTKPPGWKIKQDEVWVKNQDSRGNVYYYNQLTNETRWLPPCQVCNKEVGKRICLNCDFCIFCVSCYERHHDALGEEGKTHQWKASDIDKERLEKGEMHCIKCSVKAAKRVCKVCRDAFCEDCFKDIHNMGNLQKHPWVTWKDFKKGWQEVKGRVDGEKDYYFNATTQETSFEKPEELMLEEELEEYKMHVKYKKENDKNLKRIEKLTEKVAQFQYEKDQLWFEANMKKTAEKEELEMLRQQLEAADAKKKDRLKKMLLHPIKFYKEWQIEKKRAQQAYRRKLLLSAKQRKQIGMDHAPTNLK